MLIQEKYNTKENGYGPDADPASPATDKLRIWAKFYGCGDGFLVSLAFTHHFQGTKYYFPTFEEAEKEAKTNKDKYLKVGKHYLNVPVYLKRMRITIEAFLYEASHVARDYGLSEGFLFA